MSVDKTLEKIKKKGGKKRKKFLSKMDKEAKAHEMKDIHGQKFRKRLGATIPDHKRVAKEKQLSKEIGKTKNKKLKLRRATGVTISPKKATAKKAKEKWSLSKYTKKIRKGRKEKGEWYLGKHTFDKPKESDTAAGRKSIADRKSAAEAKKSASAAKKLSAQEKADRVAAPKGKKRLTVKQKDKKGKLKDVTYHKYKKESKTAGSFRSAFKSNCAGKGSGDSFSWQGRSYSCARASDKKKKKTKSPSSHQKYLDTKKKYS